MAPRFSLTEASYLKGLIRMATSICVRCDPATLVVQIYPVGKKVKAMVIAMPTHEIIVSAGDFDNEAQALETLCDVAEQRAFALSGIASKL